MLLPYHREQEFKDEGKDVVPGVWDVLDKIKVFSEKVSSSSRAHVGTLLEGLMSDCSMNQWCHAAWWGSLWCYIAVHVTLQRKQGDRQSPCWHAR